MRYIGLNLLLFVLALLAEARVLSFQLSNFGRSTIVLPATRQSEQEDSNISSQQPKTQFALLIDADNSPYYITQSILNTIAELGGDAIIRRVYGDFTLEQCQPWRAVALNNSIIPVSVPMSAQKDTTDAALIIDAMEILFTEPSIGGFAIVSSDSDFTDLAQRLREEGKQVIGFGQQQAPAPLIKACHSFIYVDDTILQIEAPPPSASLPSLKNVSWTQTKQDMVVNLIHYAIDVRKDEDGWVDMGNVGVAVLSMKDDFNVRDYGFEKLSHLLAAYPNEFQVTTKNDNLYVRRRQGPLS